MPVVSFIGINISIKGCEASKYFTGVGGGRSITKIDWFRRCEEKGSRRSRYLGDSINIII